MQRASLSTTATLSPHDDPQIIQSLMVYVYNDRIVFQMKNYGKALADVVPLSWTVMRDIKSTLEDSTGNEDSTNTSTTPGSTSSGNGEGNETTDGTGNDATTNTNTGTTDTPTTGNTETGTGNSDVTNTNGDATTTDPVASDDSNLGLILGIVGGALALIGLGFGAFVFLSIRKKSAANKE